MTNHTLNINPINVLDKGFVRLISSMGDDLSIVRAARVSYDAAWRTGEDEGSDLKLLRYLWKNKHTTPFESVTFTFEVKAPIFVLRQWHRHRTQSYNELSARYKELPNEYFVPDPGKIGEQSKLNKQARDLSSFDLGKRSDEVCGYQEQCENAFKKYKELLDADWPRELARMVLPVSTYSHMFVTLNLRNLLHFLELRRHEHAQYEIRVYADAMFALATYIIPHTMRIFNEPRTAS